VVVAVQETWQGRDLPVLEAIVQAADEHGFVDVRNLDVGGLDREAVKRAVVALVGEDPPFFTGVEGGAGGRYELIMGVTGHARRAAKAWPSPETLADRLIAELARAADSAEDEQTRSRLRRIAVWFGSAGRDVLVAAMGQAMAAGTLGA
jgi:hypothetical protein